MNQSTQLLENHLAQTTMYPMGLDIVRAEGIYLFDRNGKKYIDMISGVGVSSLGHNHPKINQAIKVQIDKHMHVMVYGEFLQDAQIKAAKLLTDLLPSSLDTCFFVNSGTEANEAALKLAKRVTRRKKMVSFLGSYHGSTHGSLSVSGNEIKRKAFEPLLPNIHFIRFNMVEDLEIIDDQTACVIIETIQGDAGIRIPTKEFMKKLREKCDQTGTLLIFDEIQCGVGRSGTMFAFEQFGITPDILTLGKALAGGLPVGCMISSRKNMEQFTFDPMLGHISTFAGHPVICAAVAATLEIFRDEKILQNVEEKGSIIEKKLRTHPSIREIRRRGLFFAIDLESEQKVNEVVKKNLEQGLISFWFLSNPNSFRIAPPLTITLDEINTACEIILNSL